MMNQTSINKNFIHDIAGPGIPISLICINFIFILLPFTFLTGPFLPDLFLSIVALYFLITSIQKKLKSYFQNTFVYIFATFYFYLLLRGLFSSYPYESLIAYNGPIFYFRYLFFILGVYYLLNLNPRLIQYFCITLVTSIVFAVLDGYLQWATGFNIFGFQSPSIRVTGIFRDEEILGHYLAHVVPLAFALLIFVGGMSSKKIMLYMVFLVISEVMIFITNDRAAFLKIFQFTLLLIVLSNHFKIYRIISFLISALIIYFLLQFSSDSITRYSETLKSVSETTIPYMPWTKGHEKHFSVTVEMFQDNPIFGQGPQLFKTLCKIIPSYQDRCTSHPHNYYFQTLGELGAIGIIFLLIAFFYLTFILWKQFIYHWFKKKKSDPIIYPDHILSLYAHLFILVWPLIPHQSFYNNWLNVLVFLPVGFLMYFLDRNQKN